MLPQVEIPEIEVMDAFGPLDFITDAVKTVGDFLNVGNHIKNLVSKALDPVNDLIDHADETIRGLLEEIETTIDDTLLNISQTYQDNLNITIDSLDAFIQNQIASMLNAFQTINDLIQDDIKLVGETARNILSDAKTTIAQTSIELEKSLKNILVIAGETVSFVLDKAVYNLITLAGWILLGIGLLVILVAVLKRGLPEGAAGILVWILITLFIGLFGAVALVPKFRTYIMRFTGIGLKQRLETVGAGPRILVVSPDTIHIGTTQEISLIGSNLLQNGRPPQISIGGQNVGLNADSDTTLVVNVSNLNLASGSRNIVLTYPELEDVKAIVKIEKPVPETHPDLRISRFTINPSSPEQKIQSRATIRIRNAGQGDAAASVARWKPHDQHPGVTYNVPALSAGQSTEFTLDYTYPQAGSFTTTLRVDVFNRVDESQTSETNNVITKSIRVIPYQPRLIANKTIRVNVSSGDVNTGITVARGDRLRIECNSTVKIKIAVLTIKFNANGWQDSDSGNLPMNNQKLFALLFKIGGSYGKAGKLYDRNVTKNGKLSLRINSGPTVPFGINFQYSCNVRVWR